MLGGKELDERFLPSPWLKYKNMEQRGSLKMNPELTEYVDSFKDLIAVVLSWGDFDPPNPREHLAMSGDIFGCHNWGEGAIGI